MGALMQIHSEVVLSAKQHPLAVTTYSAEHGADASARGVVLIAPAIGVPQGFYGKFATWLAQQGLVAVTFDYSGMGASLKASSVPLKQIQANVLDWGADAARVLDTLKRRYPDLPLYWVGHSLGGQLISMVDHAALRKAITVGTGSGYWRENSPELRRRAPLFWYVFVPLLTPLFGYFPGKRLNMVGDLPAGVITQWRRWCLHPDYIASEGEAMRAQYAAVRTPITSFSFTDDDYMSARNTEHIHSLYTNAPKKMQRIAPADIGAHAIRHFGFFKAHFKDTLWHKLLAELNETSIVNREDTL